MALHIITVCHMEPEIIAWSISRYFRTTQVRPDRWLVLDNKWPIEPEYCTPLLDRIATGLIGTECYTVLSIAETNLGGHGGVSHLLREFQFKPEDYVLIYDPDSNPLRSGWLEAMLAVLDSDPTMGYISLLDERKTDNPWTYETIASHKVALLAHPEMWNVTLFRATLLDKGMQSDADKWGAKFYGHVEPPMFRYAREKGMRNGYLWDYREAKCPIPHPKSYQRWKEEHAYGRFTDNFDVWVRNNSK